MTVPYFAYVCIAQWIACRELSTRYTKTRDLWKISLEAIYFASKHGQMTEKTRDNDNVMYNIVFFFTKMVLDLTVPKFRIWKTQLLELDQFDRRREGFARRRLY